jgi:hypothetical protein
MSMLARIRRTAGSRGRLSRSGRWMAAIGRSLGPAFFTIVLLGLSFLSHAATASGELSDGPRSLVIAYQAPVGHRAEFRSYLASTVAPRLRKLQAQGVLSQFRIYFGWYPQATLWDALVELNFTSFEAVGQWNEIERTMPGGLDAAGLALAAPVVTVSADLPWARNEREPIDGEVYYFLPYEYNKTDEYRDYVQGYVLPQFDGWIAAGALTGYEIFMNRFPVGPSWDSLVILRYRDLSAFGRRQMVLQQVREGLRKDPAWLGWHNRKADVRSESENNIAELIAH